MPQHNNAITRVENNMQIPLRSEQWRTGSAWIPVHIAHESPLMHQEEIRLNANRTFTNARVRPGVHIFRISTENSQSPFIRYLLAGH